MTRAIEQFPILFNPSILFPRWTNRFHRSRSIINSCSSRTRSKERASVYLAAEGRKRKAISLIAAVKEREKRGNGTKTLHNRCQRPIKEHRLRPFQLSSLPAIFFISWNSKKDMDLVSRERPSRKIRGLEGRNASTTSGMENEIRPNAAFAFKLFV